MTKLEELKDKLTRLEKFHKFMVSCGVRQEQWLINFRLTEIDIIKQQIKELEK